MLIAAFAPGTAIAEDAGTRLEPVAALIGGVASARGARRGFDRRLILAGAIAGLLGLLAVLPRDAVVEAPVVLRPERAQVVTKHFDKPTLFVRLRRERSIRGERRDLEDAVCDA